MCGERGLPQVPVPVVPQQRGAQGPQEQHKVLELVLCAEQRNGRAGEHWEEWEKGYFGEPVDV